MLLRTCRIVLLCLLNYPSSLAAADVLIKHKQEEHHDSTSLSSKDLEHRLRRFFRNDLLVYRLLDGIFIQQTPTYSPIVPGTSFSSYRGKKIGSITLHKQGRWGYPDSWWRSILHSITSLTSDEVIWEQLHIAEGDILEPQKLRQSEASLDELPSITQANITVKHRTDSRDAVDIHVTTQDQMPVRWALNPFGLKASLGYNNLLGWGHNLQGQLWSQQGLSYGVTYNAPNIARSGITSELKYHHTPQETLCLLRVFRKLDGQACYVGALTLGHTTRDLEWLLDDSSQLQPTTWSFYRGGSWLGRAWGKNQKKGQLVMTTGIVRQRFTQRPTVAPHINRYFHHHVLSAASVGFVYKDHYKDQRIDGLGDIECIPYGSKINLIGGYQFGEFFNRPYLRLDIVQGGRLFALGHWHGVVNVGGFWHAHAIEQGILKMYLQHFTPLLKLGNQSMRHFINLSYLGGFNLFTGEHISTNSYQVKPDLRDPFPGGTQRFQLGLETVIFSSLHLAGCQVAALSFVEAVRLQDTQGKVKQPSFCKALGMGFRCTHPHWRLGVLQVKVSYQPLIQGIGLEIGRGTQSLLEDFDIDEPGTIPFQAY